MANNTAPARSAISFSIENILTCERTNRFTSENSLGVGCYNEENKDVLAKCDRFDSRHELTTHSVTECGGRVRPEPGVGANSEMKRVPSSALDLHKHTFYTGSAPSKRNNAGCVKQNNENKEKYFNSMLTATNYERNRLVLPRANTTNRIPIGTDCTENCLADLNGYFHRHVLTHVHLSGFGCITDTQMLEDDTTKTDPWGNTGTDTDCIKSALHTMMDSECDTSLENTGSDSHIFVVSMEAEKHVREYENRNDCKPVVCHDKMPDTIKYKPESWADIDANLRGNEAGSTKQPTGTCLNIFALILAAILLNSGQHLQVYIVGQLISRKIVLTIHINYYSRSTTGHLRARYLIL